MKRMSIALLGMGRIGKIHFKNIGQHFPEAAIVAVADPQYDEALFKTQHGNVFFTKDPHEAIARQEVDAVLICTPTTSHAGLIEKASDRENIFFAKSPWTFRWKGPPPWPRWPKKKALN